jgi:hypothetical protein
LLARKHFTYLLSPLLAAILAWPSGVPVFANAPISLEQPGNRQSADHSGLSIQSRERKALVDEADRSDLSDDFESSDDREESTYLPASLRWNLFDLPSLIPLTAEFVARGWENRTLRSSLSPPLRC